MAAAGSLRTLLAGNFDAGAMARALVDWFRSFDGELGASFRRVVAPLRLRPAGVAVAAIFPLPWLPHVPGRDGDHLFATPATTLWANIWVGLLNWMYGEKTADVCDFRPSAPQERVLQLLHDRALELTLYVSKVDMRGRAMHSLLQLHLDDYNDIGGVRPLGMRAGLPATAAVVDVQAALEKWDQLLAGQCSDPDLCGIALGLLGLPASLVPHRIVVIVTPNGW